MVELLGAIPLPARLKMSLTGIFPVTIVKSIKILIQKNGKHTAEPIHRNEEQALGGPSALARGGFLP